MLLIDALNLVLDLVRGRLRQHRRAGANGEGKGDNRRDKDTSGRVEIIHHFEILQIVCSKKIKKYVDD
jgi:hypothetical protein